MKASSSLSAVCQNRPVRAWSALGLTEWRKSPDNPFLPFKKALEDTVSIRQPLDQQMSKDDQPLQERHVKRPRLGRPPLVTARPDGNDVVGEGSELQPASRVNPINLSNKTTHTEGLQGGMSKETEGNIPTAVSFDGNAPGIIEGGQPLPSSSVPIVVSAKRTKEGVMIAATSAILILQREQNRLRQRMAFLRSSADEMEQAADTKLEEVESLSDAVESHRDLLAQLIDGGEAGEIIDQTMEALDDLQNRKENAYCEWDCQLAMFDAENRHLAECKEKMGKNVKKVKWLEELEDSGDLLKGHPE